MWRHLAACRGLGPDLFFPDRGDPTKEAKAVCATCPVTAECLDWSLNGVHPAHIGMGAQPQIGERFGIWGGRTERERRKFRKTAPSSPGTPHPTPRREGP